MKKPMQKIEVQMEEQLVSGIRLPQGKRRNKEIRLPLHLHILRVLWEEGGTTGEWGGSIKGMPSLTIPYHSTSHIIVVTR